MAEKNDCVFCKIIAGKIKANVIADEENFLVINDAYPKTEGHCLIIPKKHYTTLLDLPSTIGSEFIDIAKKQALRLIKEGKAEGFNVCQNNFEIAGQIVPHVHFHIIPRKKGDKIKWD